MILYASYFCFGCFSLAFLMNLYKVLTAELAEDRILALDTMFINAIAVMVLYGIAADTAIFFEASMIIAMLGFISTVAYARFILRGNIIE